jgi:UDP-glucose 4-epimerase
MKSILITGGSGYIGSQTAKVLLDNGYQPIVVDREIKHYFMDNFIEKSFQYNMSVDSWIDKFLIDETPHIDAIIHFAANHLVHQSVTDPDIFYQNNVINSEKLLSVCKKLSIPIIFSSTSSVYGNPTDLKQAFTESDQVNPMNPYARSKLAIEWMIEDYANAFDFNYIILRYFNAAGADPKLKMGYVQRPATHVIPLLMSKINNNEKFKVFGNTYPTKDGTCIRDYIHVQDLAYAHLKSLELILKEKKVRECFNVGTGTGYSVLDLINTTSEVLGKEPNFEIVGPREGDPAYLVADARKISLNLNWQPYYSLDDIIRHSWGWELNKNKIIGDL